MVLISFAEAGEREHCEWIVDVQYDVPISKLSGSIKKYLHLNSRAFSIIYAGMVVHESEMIFSLIRNAKGITNMTIAPSSNILVTTAYGHSFSISTTENFPSTVSDLKARIEEDLWSKLGSMVSGMTREHIILAKEQTLLLYFPFNIKLSVFGLTKDEDLAWIFPGCKLQVLGEKPFLRSLTAKSHVQESKVSLIPDDEPLQPKRKKKVSSAANAAPKRPKPNPQPTEALPNLEPLNQLRQQRLQPKQPQQPQLQQQQNLQAPADCVVCQSVTATVTCFPCKHTLYCVACFTFLKHRHAELKKLTTCGRCDQTVQYSYNQDTEHTVCDTCEKNDINIVVFPCGHGSCSSCQHDATVKCLECKGRFTSRFVLP